MEGISIFAAQDAEDERTKEECCPGKPIIIFTSAPSVSVRLINPQPSSAHFSWTLPIQNDDTLASLRTRMQKEKFVKGKKILMHLRIEIYY